MDLINFYIVRDLIIYMVERHIRWNYEMSLDLDDVDGREGLRYHFVIVDDKDRRGILCKILEQLAEFYNVTSVREVNGKVKNSKLRYLFKSYDTLTSPKMIDWKKVGKVVKRDKKLYERARGNIEDYVARIYE